MYYALHSTNENLGGVHSAIIHIIRQRVPASACVVYVNAEFDTIEKALSNRKTAEKGAKAGLPWSITDFGSPALFYGIVGAAVSVGWQHTLQKRRRGNN